MSDDYGSISIEAPDEKRTTKQRKPRTNRLKSKAQKEKPEKIEEPKSKKSSKDDEEPIKKSKRAKNKRGTGLKVSLFFVSILLLSATLYLGLGFYGIPYYLEKQLQAVSNNNDQLNFNSTSIAFNPLSFDLNINQLVISDKAKGHNENDLLTIPKIEFKISPEALLNGQIVSTQTNINSPHIVIYKRKDGNFNVNDSLTNITTSKIIEQIPVNFSLENIEAKNGSFNYLDNLSSASHLATEINLTVPYIGNTKDKFIDTSNLSFSALVNGSPVNFSSGDSINSDKLKFSLVNIELEKYYKYLPATIPFDLTKGIGNGEVELALNNSIDNDFHLSIKLDASDVLLKHHDNNSTLQFPSASLDADIMPFDKKITVRKLNLQKPQLRTNVQLNEITDIFKNETKDTTVKLQNLQINKATISDQSGKNNLLSKLKVEVNNYSNKENSGEFKLSALMGISPISWQGKLKDESFVGPLTIDKLSITKFAQLTKIQLNKKDSGQLSLSTVFSHTKNEKAYSSKFSKTTILIKNASFYDKTTKWLVSTEISLKNATFSGDKSSLGDVTIKGAKLNIDNAALPQLLTKFNKNSDNSLASLSFNGKANISKNNLPLIQASKLSINLKQLDKDKLTIDNFDLQAKLKNGGTFSGQGRCQLKPFAIWLSSKFKKIPSNNISAAIKEANLFSDIDGKVSGSGVIVIPSFSFKGSIDITKSEVASEYSPIRSWLSANFQKLHYRSSKKQFLAETITINQPYIDWQRSNDQPSPFKRTENMLLGLSKGSGKSIKVDKIILKNGIVNIADKRVSPQWNGRISKFNGVIDNLNSKEKDTAIIYDFSGSFANSAITAQGNMTPFAAPPSHDLSLIIKDFPAATFSAQMPQIKLVGAIPKYVNVDLVQEKNESGIKTAVDLQLMNIKPKRETTAIALAMLQGNSDFPHFTIANHSSDTEKDLLLLENIKRYAKQLQIKTDISPFLLADERFFDLKGKNKAEFLFGQTVLSGDGIEHLIRLREFLTAYPELAVQITGNSSQKVDRLAMQEQLSHIEEARVRDINSKRLETWKQEQAQKLNDIPDVDDFMEEDIFIPLQAEPVYVTDKMLIELANQRAETVATVLNGQLALDTDRIQVIKTKSLTEDASNAAVIKLASKNFIRAY